MIEALTFLKIALAVYRMGIAVAEERGAADIFRKIRTKYGAETPPTPQSPYYAEYNKTNLQAGLSCPYCVSFWFALIGAICLSITGINHDIILNWLALAGLAALFVKWGTP